MTLLVLKDGRGMIFRSLPDLHRFLKRTTTKYGGTSSDLSSPLAAVRFLTHQGFHFNPINPLLPAEARAEIAQLIGRGVSKSRAYEIVARKRLAEGRGEAWKPYWRPKITEEQAEALKTAVAGAPGRSMRSIRQEAIFGRRKVRYIATPAQTGRSYLPEDEYDREQLVGAAAERAGRLVGRFVRLAGIDPREVPGLVYERVDELSGDPRVRNVDWLSKQLANYLRSIAASVARQARREVPTEALEEVAAPETEIEVESPARRALTAHGEQGPELGEF